mmetsp:Transcript_14658/g.30264  ORF Transcript_14658/g.30264 Transcript_14658/m.30264 type:complete len:84 (-) Transcript_14658:102-353(-)
MPLTKLEIALVFTDKCKARVPPPPSTSATLSCLLDLVYSRWVLLLFFLKLLFLPCVLDVTKLTSQRPRPEQFYLADIYLLAAS